MTALSTVVVQYGIDAQFRGYPLPFLTIGSSLSDFNKSTLEWRIPNLLLSLALCLTAAIAGLIASRMRVPSKTWFYVGLGVIAAVGIIAYRLWHSIASPITGPDALERAMLVSAIMRHLLAIGALISAACLFVSFLRASNVKGLRS